MPSKSGPIQQTIFLCTWCNEPLPAGRTDRKTHEKCRQKMWRYKRAVKRETDKMMKSLSLLENYMMFQDTREEGIELLKSVISRINTVCENANIKRIK